MGLESGCTARYGGRASDGKALLETDELIFRGSFRLTVPYHEIKDVQVEGGKLILDYDGDELILEVGSCAEDWANRILYPKVLVDKLGVKPEHRVAVLGLDPGFLGGRTRAKPATRLGKEHDLVFLALEKAADLTRIEKVLPSLTPAGALWTVRTRGKKDVSESIVRETARAAGLVDVKVARFSETQTAEKFVRPRSKR
jgi:hypothetical protein